MEHFVSPKSRPQPLWYSDRYLGWQTSAFLFTHPHTCPKAVWGPPSLSQIPIPLAHCILVSLPAQPQTNLLARPQSGHSHTRSSLSFLSCLWASTSPPQTLYVAFQTPVYRSLHQHMNLAGFYLWGVSHQYEYLIIYHSHRKRESYLRPAPLRCCIVVCQGFRLLLPAFPSCFACFLLQFLSPAQSGVLQTSCSSAACPHSVRCNTTS